MIWKIQYLSYINKKGEKGMSNLFEEKVPELYPIVHGNIRMKYYEKWISDPAKFLSNTEKYR